MARVLANVWKAAAFAVLPTLLIGPAHASSVVASATSAWSYDPGTKLYTYSYVVTNAVDSPNHLATFVVRPAGFPTECTSPPGWICMRGYQRDSTAVAWAAVDLGDPPPDWNYQLFVAPVHIAPGEVLAGFRITSEFPPDSSAQFVAQGFDTIPGGGHSFDQPPLNPVIWEEGWVGTTIVPSLGGTVGVGRSEDGSHVRFYPPIPNPARGSVDLRFHLAAPHDVKIVVVDAAGRRLSSIDSGELPTGPHQVRWSGTDETGRRLPGGVYFYRLLIDGQQVGKQRVVLLP